MRRAIAIGALLLTSLALASCGEAPPPEGFHIQLRLISLDPQVIDRVTVAFIPDGDSEFMFVEPMSYADGAITFRVAADGAAEIEIAGSQVAAFAEQEAAGGAYVYDLEVYSDDTVMQTPPRVNVLVERDGMTIAQGGGFMPQWPPILSLSTTFQVECRPGMAANCFP